MKIIAANFKANLTRRAVEVYAMGLEKFLGEQDFKRECEVRLFPSHTALLEDRYSHFRIGAQNAYFAPSGGFTGEIGLLQLQEFGIESLLIGHSERRTLFFENQDFINEKFAFYAREGFEIVYCVGEDLSVREQGEAALTRFLQAQLEGIDVDYQNLIVAYEPIWAIGTGVSASVEQIERTHKILSSLTSAPLLYGGSVNASNAGEILSIPQVSGVLVGSASLTLEGFCEIIKEGV